MSRTLKMIVGCTLPPFLLFLLPLIGISDGLTLVVAIGLLFACHLFMTHGHDHDHHRRASKHGNTHAHHQH